jgi:hypothetical protein
MSTSLGYQIDRHPIAQSFFVEETSGVFITKVDLYFKSKSTTDPVCLQIRPMDNGHPSTSLIVPGSVVYVNSSDIATDDLARNKSSFIFEEPLYLKGLRDYAIVVITNSADYNIFIAQIDEFEVGTTAARIAKNPSSGSLFYSQNGGTFTAAQEQDLVFEIHRASFTSGVNGTVSLHNAKLPLKLLDTDPIITTAGSTTVTVRDIGHGFTVSDDVRITGVDSATNVGGLAATSILGTHTITGVDWTGYTFTAGAAADSDGIGGGLNVKVSKNIPFSAYFKNSQMLNPVGTTSFSGLKTTTGKSFAGTETAYQKANNFTMSFPNDTIYTREVSLVADEDIETSELGSNIKSLEAQYTFSTTDEYVSPMLDLQRSSMTLIDAIIDKQDSAATSGFNVPLTYVDETQPSGGSSAAKHITKSITITEPAVGLNIIFAANRPPGSDFEVYYRTTTSDQNIELQNFILAKEETSNGVDDDFIFREYRYLPGGSGGSLPEFTKFQIKIVMRATDKSRVPVFRDLRVIALRV